MPIWGVGVTLSHLILDAVTSSDSSPIRSHVREYVCPSKGGPLVVMTSVSGGAVLTITVCIIVYTYVSALLTSHTYSNTITCDSVPTPHCLTHVLSIA